MQADSDEEVSSQIEVESDPSLDEIHSAIAKLKEKKSGKKASKKVEVEVDKEKTSSTLLSFDDDLNGGQYICLLFIGISPFKNVAQRGFFQNSR